MQFTPFQAFTWSLKKKLLLKAPHQLSPVQDGRHRKVRPRICRKLRTLPFHSWWVLFEYSCYCMSPKNNIIEVKECARKGEKNILLPISWESSLLSTSIASTLVFSKRPFLLNPLPPEFFFSSFFGTSRKIGSFRLPTHSRDAHRKFVWWSLLKLKSKVLLNVTIWAR